MARRGEDSVRLTPSVVPLELSDVSPAMFTNVLPGSPLHVATSDRNDDPPTEQPADLSLCSFSKHYWTRRYRDDAAETEFLLFSHENPTGRFVLLGSGLLQCVRVVIDDRPLSLLAVVIGFHIVVALAILVTLPDVARQHLPRRFHLNRKWRAILCEHVVMPMIVAHVAFAVLQSPLAQPIDYSTGQEYVWRFTTDRSLLIVNSICAPVRLMTAIPYLVVLILVQAMAVVLFESKVCEVKDGVFVVLLFAMEAVSTALLQWAWEHVRRTGFESQNSAKAQATRGAALVAFLDQQVTACASTHHKEDELLPIGSTSSASKSVERRACVVSVVLHVNSADLAEHLVAKSALLDMMATNGQLHSESLTRSRLMESVADRTTVTLTSDDDDDVAMAAAACALARQLHQTFLGLQSESRWRGHLQIGVELGEIFIVHSSSAFHQPLLVGRPSRVAAKLADLALPNCTLLGPVAAHRIHGIFAATTMHRVFVENQLCAVYLLGLQLASATFEPCLGIPGIYALSNSEGAVIPVSASTPNANTNLAHDRSSIHELIAADQQQITFKWSWLYGWYFPDSEVEEEFRTHENGGKARFAPFIISIAIFFLVLVWLFVEGADQNHWVWISMVAASLFLPAMALTVKARFPGQMRFMMAVVLESLFEVFLYIALYFTMERSAMRKYMIPLCALMSVPSFTLWFPSALPYFAAELTFCFRLLVAQHWVGLDLNRASVASAIAGTSMATTMTFCIVQAQRMRNRQCFADVVSARNSADRWKDAELALVARLKRFMPHAAACAIVSDAIRNRIGTRREKYAVDNPPSIGVNDASFIAGPQTVVLALRLERPTTGVAPNRRAKADQPASLAPLGGFAREAASLGSTDAALAVAEAAVAHALREVGGADKFVCHAGGTSYVLLDFQPDAAKNCVAVHVVQAALEVALTVANLPEVQPFSLWCGVRCGVVAGRVIGSGAPRVFDVASPVFRNVQSSLREGIDHLETLALSAEDHRSPA
jgi:class 3 adenylate cyclase